MCSSECYDHFLICGTILKTIIVASIRRYRQRLAPGRRNLGYAMFLLRTDFFLKTSTLIYRLFDFSHVTFSLLSVHVIGITINYDGTIAE